MTEVEDADAASLASSGAAPSDLPDSPRARDDAAKVGSASEGCLEKAVGVVRDEFPDTNGEGAGLDEDHGSSIRHWLTCASIRWRSSSREREPAARASARSRFPEADRAWLAAELAASLDGRPESTANEAWDSEIERRADEVRDGTASLTGWDEVSSRLDISLGHGTQRRADRLRGAPASVDGARETTPTTKTRDGFSPPGLTRPHNRTYFSPMSHFTWDPTKAEANRRKHGIDFADAVEVLYDPRALTMADDHPEEERYITTGTDTISRVLTVAYTWRQSTIRIISARKATARERAQYER